MGHIRIKPQINTDVIIVGGGPAGSSAAYHMRVAGINVIIIDRHCFPRDKVCGDFISPTALIELQKMGVTHLEEFAGTNVIRSAALHIDGREVISTLFPNIQGLPSYGRVIPRTVLDEWLLNKAREVGADVLQGHVVKRFGLEDNHVLLSAENSNGQIELRSRLLIGADGSNSLIAHQLCDQSVGRLSKIFAVRAYSEGTEGPPDRADLFFSADTFPGYYWFFPTGQHTANVGLGILTDSFPSVQYHLRTLMERVVRDDKALARRLKNAKIVGKIAGWPLHTYTSSFPLVGNRVILIGDAAGLINPINGEGIQYALLSGRLAAGIAKRALAIDDFSEEVLGEYARSIDLAIRSDMALPNLIISSIRNRSLNPLWIKALKTIATRARLDTDYAKITGGILLGSVSSNEAFNPAIIIGTIEQALLSFGFETLLNLPDAPNYLAKTVLDTGRVGFGFFYDMLMQPNEFLRWGNGIVDNIAEVSFQRILRQFEKQ